LLQAVLENAIVWGATILPVHGAYMEYSASKSHRHARKRGKSSIKTEKGETCLLSFPFAVRKPDAGQSVIARISDQLRIRLQMGKQARGGHSVPRRAFCGHGRLAWADTDRRVEDWTLRSHESYPFTIHDAGNKVPAKLHRCHHRRHF